MTPDELKRIKKSGRRQKRYINKFKRVGNRLKAIRAAALFPSAMVPLIEGLEKLGVTEDEYTLEVPAVPESEKKAVSKKEPVEEPAKTETTPAAADAGPNFRPPDIGLS